MLSDREIERAAAQLADYRKNDVLSQILDEYALLVDDYKRLKSDYEEERETREKYKQMARDQERNPFVLVLVDGDGYVFKDSLLAKRAEGGSEAAQGLNDEVKASLRRRGLEHCQVMVRIYANVFGLSKALSRTGVIGADSRSLAPFIASFNRSYGLTDFVDAGQLKENADFKLRAMLRLYADNSQCKHIYFAACHDVGYVSELTPFMGNSSKFTLVNTPGVRFHDEFTKLGLGIEEFRSVFRDTPIDGAAQYRSANSGAGPSGRPAASPIKALPVKPSSAPSSASNGDQRPACLFYSLGKCRYGKSCKMAHVNPPAEANGSDDSGDLPSPIGLAGTGTSTASAGASKDVPAPLAKLPKKHDIPAGSVPVNENNHRLDYYLRPVGSDVMNRLKARIDKRRVCNNYQLRGSCDAGDRCEYDHEPLDAELLPALEQLARSQPCPRRGACRIQGCTHGHTCQNMDCKHRGGKAYCRLPFLSHHETLAVFRYVPSVTKQRKPVAGGSGSSVSSTSSTRSASTTSRG